MKGKWGLFALALAIGVGALTTRGVSADLHFGLSKSEPAADASVGSLDEIRLWFTQVPQENSASIRLINSAGDALETSELMSDASDGKVVYVSIEADVAPGGYTVAWRGIGDDGHVVRGDFAFSVAARQ